MLLCYEVIAVDRRRTKREMNMLKKAMLQIAFAVAVTVTFASFAASPAQAGWSWGVIQSGR
jgi:hypothetical protein